MSAHPAAQRVATDIVVLTLDDQRQLRALTRLRDRPPFAGVRALPGAALLDDEDLEAGALRALARASGLERPRHVEQLATFGTPGRDPRGRTISVSYLALLPAPIAVTAPAEWSAALATDQLAFDHAEILSTAIRRLRGKLSYSNVAYGLLPDAFTLSDLQGVYAAVLGRSLDKRNFRKKIAALGMLEETGLQRRGSHRPAQLYRFAQPTLVHHDDAMLG